MFGLSGFEIAIILLFAFLIFGPDKLPDIARTIGRVVRQFRSAQEQMTNVIKAEVYDPVKDLEPLVNPFSNFSLDGSGDNAEKADTKKKATKKTTDKAKAPKAADDMPLPEGGQAVGGQDGQQLSNEEMQEALKRDAEKAKKRALRETAQKIGTSSSSSLESFAARRARLEQEHAKAKAEKASAEAAAANAPVTAAATATPSPLEAGVVAKPVTSDERKEDESSN